VTAYIDTSALLRIVLREAGALDDLRSYDVWCRANRRRCRSGTLDAMHLATALIWRDRVGPLPAIATHDSMLGTAALAFGFDVLGI